MAPRANWKGYLRLSLVTCPIALYPATSEAEKISFNQLNKKTGHRIKYLKVDADTGDWRRSKAKPWLARIQQAITGRDRKHVSLAFSSPHPAHAGTDVDTRALACSSHRSAGRNCWP